tara:strand:+ start:318 stop:710 length:393 start_codon:yes stop_codon:yes gene_type:complete
MNENGKTISDADKKRLKSLMGASTGTVAGGMGNAISDKDKDIIGEIIGSITGKTLGAASKTSMKAKNKTPSPIPMPAKIKQMRADKARRDSKGADTTAPLEQMKYGGKVNGYKNGGCVMAGRGGKFKGIS